ncbi:MAG: hypothetical protein LLG37_10460 [Spirochaetia bacterium]|nr:hypothetical protein [Spirochaetia bacterium]
MLKRVIIIAAILSFYACAYASWVDADGYGQYEPEVFVNAGSSYMPDIAIDKNGYPHVTWYDSDNGNLEIFYLEWNGYEWVDADGAGRESMNISQTPANSEYPRIAIDNQSRPYITWEDGSGTDREVYFLRWNGTEWVDADGAGMGQINISNTTGYSGHPVIAVDTAGNPRIAWMQQEGADEDDCDIYYGRWNGTAWVGANPGPPAKIYDTPYYSAWPHIKLNSNNRPCIVWADGADLDREIYYLGWNGTDWVDADGNSNESVVMSHTPKYSGWADVAIDSSDRPHIAWEDTSAGDQNIFYLKWNGLAWVDADGSGQDAINISGTYHFSTVPTIRIHPVTGAPYIVYSEGAIETCDVYCKTWNGTAWTDASGIGTAFLNVRHNAVNSEWPSFDLDHSGRPHVVWSDGVVMQAHDICYQKWENEGTPTATPTLDLSGTPYPTATATRTFTPTLTISETPTQTKVLADLFTPGPCWVDVDGAGNEYNPAFTGRDPQMQLGSTGLPYMVWEYGSSIYFSRRNGTFWAGADTTSPGSEMISGTVFQCASPQLKLDSNDRPCAAWTGFFTESTMIYYLHWDGSQWVDVDGSDQLQVSVPIINGGYARDVSLDLDAVDRPGVAWVDYPENLTYTVKDIFYYRWDGSDWVDADGSGRLQGMITDNTLQCASPSLCYDSSSQPGIAFIRGTALCYLKWNGAVWVDADGAGQESIQVGITPARDEDLEPQLVFDSQDRPHIAWIMKYPSGRTPAYIWFNGTSWTDITGSGSAMAAVSSDNTTVSISLALDDTDTPGVAWNSYGGVRYLKGSGTAWADVDGTGVESTAVAPSYSSDIFGVSLDFEPLGRPSLAWGDSMAGSSSLFFLQSLCLPPTPTNTPTISPTWSETPTVTLTATRSVTLTESETFTSSETHTLTQTRTVTQTPTATVTATPVPANVSVEKKAAADANQDTVLYTITVKNDPDRPVYNLTAWDTLPQQVHFGAMVEGPEPSVDGNFVFWDFGGGMTAPGTELILKFTVVINDPLAVEAFSNRAAVDYNDDFYLSLRHPIVHSNQAIFPEDTIVVFPNPFNPNTASEGALKFVNVREWHEVYIFTVSGELVITLVPAPGNNTVKWYAVNRFGAAVSKGIYYYFIRDKNSGSPVMKGKIFLIEK